MQGSEAVAKRQEQDTSKGPWAVRGSARGGRAHPTVHTEALGRGREATWVAIPTADEATTDC
jgi:hypothetical protein